MTTAAIIKEIKKLPVTEKLLLVEKTLKTIRHDEEHVLATSKQKAEKTNKRSGKKYLDDLRETVEEINLAKKGKIKLKSADQLLNEL